MIPPNRWLVLRFTARGKRTWVLRCRDGRGKGRRFRLGAHPQVGVADARKMARSMREAVRQGADPIEDARRRRRNAKAASDGVGTLRSLLDLYAVQGKGAELRRWPEYRRRIELVFGTLLDRGLQDDLTLQDLQSCADTWRSRSTASIAVLLLRPVLRWAAKPARRLCDPSLGQIEGKTVHNLRERVLSAGELKAVLPVLLDPIGLSPSAQPYAIAMRLALLTLSRRAEPAGMRWREVDLEAAVWRIPGGRHKNGAAKIVPLSRQALDLIRGQLPANGKTPDPAAYVLPRTDGGELCSWVWPTGQIMEASGTSGWTPHDLRRTGATLLGEELDVEPHIISLLLGHMIVRGAGKAYQHGRYLRAQREALQQLADHFDALVARSPAAEAAPVLSAVPAKPTGPARSDQPKRAA